MLYNFIIILNQIHYNSWLVLFSHGPALGILIVFFQAWLLFGAIAASVVCCLCHFCLHLILHLPSPMANEEKKISMFILQNSHKWLPSKFWKSQDCETPYTRTFNDFAKKVHPCFGPHIFWCLAWQICYIFKERLLQYNIQSKKRNI